MRKDCDLRVVHLVSQDNGGAGRACVRLHKALLDSGVDSIVLTAHKTSDTPQVRQLAKSKLQKLKSKLAPHLSQLPLMLYPKRHKDIFSPNLALFTPRNKLLLQTLKELKPDIVHLHWIENGFINIKDLESIQTPLIWSLHDANPYTGGCHIVASACIGVSTQCKKCPLLQSKCGFDISFLTFKRKMQTYKKLQNLTINGLSRWIAKCAKDSTLLGKKQIINLPNPIDTRIYAPIEKSIARSILNLTQPKKLIAFGAINATATKRKGYDELISSLNALPFEIKSQCELVVFGASEGEAIKDMRTTFLGHISDDLTLRIIYNACDVFITPSLLESFGQTALESLSCGTPVVCFDTSGLKDIVRHKYNGYLAKCFDIADLKAGIEWILNLDSASYENLSHNARLSARSAFDSHKVAKDYIKAYEMLIGGGADKLLAKIILFALLDSKQKKSITKFIGFGAIGGGGVKRKGYDELLCAIKNLSSKVELLAFGGEFKATNVITHSLGHLYDDATLSLAYNACDVFVVPSLAENLSNAIMESLACGVPVVAFDIGGNSDMISHKYNGYLAKDTKDLRCGIEWILNLDSASYENLSHNARISVQERFNSQAIATKYIKTYKILMGGGDRYRLLIICSRFSQPLNTTYPNTRARYVA